MGEEVGVRCLVVDDEPGVRSVLVRLLTSRGYEVREAVNGREAVAALEREPFDLVLTDIHMPEVTGVQLLAEVRRRWPEVGVVMITGVPEVQVAVASLAQGALDYMGKPFQVEEALARVQQALEKRRLILENRDYQFNLEAKVRVQADRIEELFVEGVQVLAHALEAKDAYTRGHSARVAAYATATARAMGLDDDLVAEIRLGAELHDIGKIGVREAVLLKPGKLTDQEYAHLKEHTLIGERILQPLLKDHPLVLAIVRSHHERPDGRGFPDGLVGDVIPVVTRITAVGDTFDAMTTARPYLASRPAAEALTELVRFSGTQFDPDAVQGFLRAFPDAQALPIATPERLAARPAGALVSLAI
jgi:response regulator RpfG family c-di-GMP phosphodiesterase